MINEFLWPELEDMYVDDVYFQQYGTTCHTSGETIGLLRENETSNWKSLHINWLSYNNWISIFLRMHPYLISSKKKIFGVFTQIKRIRCGLLFF